MKVSLYYHGAEEDVIIPDSCSVEIVEPQVLDLGTPEEGMIQRALENPIDSKPLNEFVEAHDSFLVIVNDHARPTPTPKVLRHVLPLLREKRYGIIVATGTHASPSEEDLKELILGEFYDELREELMIHDSRTVETINLGKTSKGTPVMINRIIEDYEAFISINSIEPHYFAGFTGGRKSFLPGIAAYDSVEANHSMALLEESRIMALEGNPLAEDLEEAARIAVKGHPTFAVNVVLDGAHNIVTVVAGDIFKQLKDGAEVARSIYSPSAKTVPDILVSVVHSPLDQNLYQAQKGFENTLLAIKQGGIMILVAACYDGIGPDDYAAMLQSAESPEELMAKFEEIKQHYQLGWHKVGSIPPFLTDKDLWMVTEIDNENLDRIFIRGFESIQEALDAAIEKKGDDANILIVKDSGNVCPVID
ncbi:MAG: nickel-dependent lactate racemase [Promethearchaeota archaeon]